MTNTTCRITRVGGSNGLTEELAEVDKDRALNLLSQFPFDDELAKREAPLLYVAPIVTFQVDGHRSLSVEPTTPGKLTISLWKKFGTSTIYDVSLERAQRAVADLYDLPWRKLCREFEKEGFNIEGAGNPLLRWLRRLLR
jgi:hypothetical protein